MKKILLTLFVFAQFNSFAQYNFAITFGTTEHDDGSSIRQIHNGGYIVVGTTYSTLNGDGDVYLAGIDSLGNVLWTKTYGGAADDNGKCVRQTPDSGFVIAGSTESFGAGASDVYLLKTNQNGDTLWTKTYGGNDNDFGYAVENTFDGGFIVTGQESSTNAGVFNIFIIKTNSNGDTLWTKSIPVGVWTQAISVKQVADSGYVLYGDFQNGTTVANSYDLVWIKTNALGNVTWTKSFIDTSGNDYARSMNETSDGGFILASEIESSAPSNYFGAKILKLDVNGDTSWTRSFGVSHFLAVTDIVEARDSGYVMTGYQYDSTTFGNHLFITRLNDTGDSLWSVMFDGVYSASGNEVQATADGGIVVAGTTYDSTLVQGDVYVVKTDQNGTLNSCHPLVTSQPLDTLIEEGDTASFYLSVNAVQPEFQWQIDSSGTFTNLSDTGIYSGANSDTLKINGVSLSMHAFYFRCIVTDSAGCSDTTRSATLTVTNTTNVSFIQSENNILFPNPARDHFNISGQVPEAVFITDIAGSLVKKENHVTRFDVSGLAPGIYSIRLIYLNRTAFLKFIKN